MEKLMKNIFRKFLITLTVIGSLTAPMTAKAGIVDSGWFEPMLGCAIGAGAGYGTAEKGQEMMMAAAFCGGGALLGVLLNMHYSNKYDTVYKNDIAELRRTIKEMELQQAMGAANNEDQSFSLRIRKVVPGQKLPNGSVTAPTVVESLVPPGETVRVGD